MVRRLKRLTLALAAIATLAATGAQGAFAAPHFLAPGADAKETTSIQATSDGTSKTGHQVIWIENESGTVVRQLTCNEFHGSGGTVQTGETSTEVTLETPAFTGNCSFIGQVATVANTGCEFVYHADGTMDIESVHENECEHGKQPIEFASANCKVEIGKQTALSGISYHNVEGGVTVEPKVESITYNATGFDCPFGTTSNGTLTTGNQVWHGWGPEGSFEWTTSSDPHFIAPGADAKETTSIQATSDGTSKTGHQVIWIENESGTVVRQLTCNEFHGTGGTVQTGETSTEVTLETPAFTGNCSFIGHAVTVANESCEFVYHADGTMDIEAVHEEACEHGQQPIEFETANCRVEIGKQTALSGIRYHNVEGGVTVEPKVENITYNATGSDCPFGTTSNGTLTTGNQVWHGWAAEGSFEWTG